MKYTYVGFLHSYECDFELLGLSVIAIITDFIDILKLFNISKGSIRFELYSGLCKRILLMNFQLYK